jgi:hypothetical protein
VSEPISASDEQRSEDAAAYLVRNPLSLKKLVAVRPVRPEEHPAALRSSAAFGRV